jgi:hypothetical protein
MFHKYLEMASGIGMRVDVPEFETREEAKEFIDDLEEGDIVLDDVIDPESGAILMEKGDTKRDAQIEDEDLPVDEIGDDDDDGGDDDRLDEYMNKLDDAVFDVEEAEEEEFMNKYSVEDIEEEFVSMGKDVAGDFLYDKQGIDENDFDSWAQSAAEDAIDGVVRYPDDETKEKIRFLKLNGIEDVAGWAADCAHSGMLQAFEANNEI